MKIKLHEEKLCDKKGKSIKDAQGNVLFKRNDVVALYQLVSLFEPKNFSLGDYKHLLTLKDKIEDCWKTDAGELDLSLDEMSLLKDYLTNFYDKCQANAQVGEFLIRTLVGVLEQIEKK